MRFYYVCMLLNYAFFERYHIQKLTDITVKVVSDFLNDYGMGVLPGDSKGRTEATVNTCIRTIIDFLEEVADRNPGTYRIKKSELYKNVKVYNKRMRRLETRKVPVFDVHYLTEPKEIFRDMPERVFSILMNVIIKKHRELLMLTALSAFAGLRPSESCNVRRQDSRLGAGIRFVILDGELSDISIDLTRERNLRSDLKNVGKIKKERTQHVYPAFLHAFYECYQLYMEHMEGCRYESDYGALTVNKQGKAMTYDNYYKKFQDVVRDAIPELLHSNDPEVINYAHLLQEHSISPHIFRHWFSVNLTLFGEDVSGLMYWRGDTSPESALTYLQNKGDLEKQFSKVSNELFDYSLWKAGKLYHDD
ncbi:MAG: tyrosine-type recombinase/integrase [Bacteroides sp.]|nr:tyrosine-type recombinase/integrase [Bacteroides sp.]MCM1549336.1 tyrosine-type recombinase/integrase [Clostridium sp.]